MPDAVAVRPFAKLLRDDDVCVCENCARYLKLAPADTVPAETKPPVAAKRLVRKRRVVPNLQAVAA